MLFSLYSENKRILFLNWFVENKSVQDHYTRQSAHLHVAQYRTFARALNIQIFGVKLWNDFVDSKLCNVSRTHSFSIFKSKCKTYIINEQRMWFDRTDYLITNSIKFNIFLCLFFSFFLMHKRVLMMLFYLSIPT